ncbi:hypothetical protein ACFVS2_26495 [Brevibacillus sp. NPDC058079]|uniref:hypothetical protein n=1 Tax=Brevibacillus sp. NPDC058079 TaxID=3346330 RepID=UPI0036E2F348
MDKRQAPLRNILFQKYFDNINNKYQAIGMFDFLECGHMLREAHDFYGAYHPIRRRCWKCAKGYPNEHECSIESKS